MTGCLFFSPGAGTNDPPPPSAHLGSAPARRSSGSGAGLGPGLEISEGADERGLRATSRAASARAAPLPARPCGLAGRTRLSQLARTIYALTIMVSKTPLRPLATQVRTRAVCKGFSGALGLCALARATRTSRYAALRAPRREMLEIVGHCLRRHVCIFMSMTETKTEDVLKTARFDVEPCLEGGVRGCRTAGRNAICAFDDVERGERELRAV